MGFLVADGGEQSPVHAEIPGIVTEQGLVFGQPVFHVVHEGARPDIIQAVEMTVKAFGNLGQSAVGPELFQELPSGGGQ